jgi:hypothetical protein
MPLTALLKAAGAEAMVGSELVGSEVFHRPRTGRALEVVAAWSSCAVTSRVYVRLCLMVKEDQSVRA